MSAISTKCREEIKEVVKDAVSTLTSPPDSTGINELVDKVFKQARANVNGLTGGANISDDALGKALHDEIVLHFLGREFDLLNRIQEYCDSNPTATLKDIKDEFGKETEYKWLIDKNAPISFVGLADLLKRMNSIAAVKALTDPIAAARQLMGISEFKMNSELITLLSSSGTVSAPSKDSVESTVGAIYEKKVEEVLNKHDQDPALRAYFELRKKHDKNEVLYGKKAECEAFRDEHKDKLSSILNSFENKIAEFDAYYAELRDETFRALVIPYMQTSEGIRSIQEPLQSLFSECRFDTEFNKYRSEAEGRYATLNKNYNPSNQLAGQLQNEIAALLPTAKTKEIDPNAAPTTYFHAYVEARRAPHSSPEEALKAVQFANVGKSLNGETLETAYQKWMFDFLYSVYKKNEVEAVVTALWKNQLGLNDTEIGEWKKKCREKKDEEIIAAFFGPEVQAAHGDATRLAKLQEVLKNQGLEEDPETLKLLIKLDGPIRYLQGEVINGKEASVPVKQHTAWLTKITDLRRDFADLVKNPAFSRFFPQSNVGDDVANLAVHRLLRFGEVRNEVRGNALFELFLAKGEAALISELRKEKIDPTQIVKSCKERKEQEIKKNVEFIHMLLEKGYLTVDGRIRILPTTSGAITEQSVVKGLHEAYTFLNKCGREDWYLFFGEKKEDLIALRAFLNREHPPKDLYTAGNPKTSDGGDAFETPEDVYAAMKANKKSDSEIEKELTKKFPELKRAITKTITFKEVSNVLPEVKALYEKQKAALLNRVNQAGVDANGNLEPHPPLRPQEIARLKLFRAEWPQKLDVTKMQLLEKACGDDKALENAFVAAKGANVFPGGANDTDILNAVKATFPEATHDLLVAVGDARTTRFIEGQALVGAEIGAIRDSGVYEGDDAPKLFETLSVSPELITDATITPNLNDRIKLAQFYIQHAVRTKQLGHPKILKAAFTIACSEITMAQLSDSNLNSIKGIGFLATDANRDAFVKASERSKTFQAIDSLYTEAATNGSYPNRSLFQQITNKDPNLEEQIHNAAGLPDRALGRFLQHYPTLLSRVTSSPLNLDLSEDEQKLLIGGEKVEATAAPKKLGALTNEIFNAAGKEVIEEFLDESGLRKEKQKLYALGEIAQVVEETPLVFHSEVNLANLKANREKLTKKLSETFDEKVKAVGVSQSSLPSELKGSVVSSYEPGELVSLNITEAGLSFANTQLSKQRAGTASDPFLKNTLPELKKASTVYKDFHAPSVVPEFLGGWGVGQAIPKLGEKTEKAALDKWIAKKPANDKKKEKLGDTVLLQQCYLEALLGKEEAALKSVIRNLNTTDDFDDLSDDSKKLLKKLIIDVSLDQYANLEKFCSFNKDFSTEKAVYPFQAILKHLKKAYDDVVNETGQ